MATGEVTAPNVPGSGRNVPLKFGWRMPMWDPLGAPATAHFSAAFPDYKYGQIVMGNNYRHAPLLAKSASTMQVLTGGKLILGIGAGWMESEYRMYGYEYPPPRIRLEQLDEAVQIIRRMWTTSP